eukprot:7871435-Pyramimonas_sp.AAC.1
MGGAGVGTGGGAHCDGVPRPADSDAPIRSIGQLLPAPACLQARGAGCAAPDGVPLGERQDEVWSSQGITPWVGEITPWVGEITPWGGEIAPLHQQ